MYMNMLARTDGLYHFADDASVFCDRVAHSEIFERNLMAQRDRLHRLRVQGLVVRQVPSGAVHPGFEIYDSHANIIGCIVRQKMNHASSFRKTTGMQLYSAD
jgi:hypothetical protein